MFNDYGEDMPSLSNISLGLFLFNGFYNLIYNFFNGHYPKQIFTFFAILVFTSPGRMSVTQTRPSL